MVVRLTVGVMKTPEPVAGADISVVDGKTVIRQPSTVSTVSNRTSRGRNMSTGDGRSSVDSLDLQETPEVRSRRQDNRREGYMAEAPVDFEQATVKTYPKTEMERQDMKDAIKKNKFLSNVLKGTELEKVVDSFYPEEVSPEELLTVQGDMGSHMFISDSGHYQVIINGDVIAEFRGGTVFGELAILYNDKRLATVKSLEKGRVWKIDRTSYQLVLIKNEMEKQDEIISFLRNVPIVKNASEMNLQSVTGLFSKEFYKTDTVIVKEGEEGDKFFIIRAGSVTIKKETEGIVAHLTRGQIFGERALLEADRLRQATVIADSPGVECLVLSCENFIDHFGDIATFIKHRASEQQHNSLETVKNKYSDIKLEDLITLSTLGVGGFGRVELVQHKTDSSKVFALKKLKRLEMIKQNQIKHVFNEKKVQLACSSSFIVKLYTTYRDKHYLYYLQEVCLGGDLFFLMHRQKSRCFTESSARFLAACIIEALAHLHERKYVYRDLKPENMMIDRKGYVKLTDFGFAKKVKTFSKTYTFAGTPEYVAPEVIQSKGHDKAVDYWGLGVFIYELLVGKTPFKSSDSNHSKTYELIVDGLDDVVFPIKMGRVAENLIRNLCKVDPSSRLGCRANGAQEVRDHNWYLGFNWDLLRSTKMRSPYVPKLTSKTDCKYMDTFAEDSHIPLEDISDTFDDF